MILDQTARNRFATKMGGLCLCKSDEKLKNLRKLLKRLKEKFLVDMKVLISTYMDSLLEKFIVSIGWDRCFNMLACLSSGDPAKMTGIIELGGASAQLNSFKYYGAPIFYTAIWWSSDREAKEELIQKAPRRTSTTAITAFLHFSSVCDREEELARSRRESSLRFVKTRMIPRETIRLPNPMIGFGVPSMQPENINQSLPDSAQLSTE